jgi:5'-3' exonuclease
MGVPKFFRWLSERYPLINQRLVENSEFDCFYLDMNGIIHNCSQKEPTELIQTEEELFQKIFSYTEHLFRIVRPRKLIYLAIDGVAPRAKMNQQRSRRFRSVKELEKNQEFIKKNSTVSPAKLNIFDSNCITPGTQFMKNLSFSFKKWLENKINHDSEWQQGCDVIFSGSEVPGEGEHKIMNYIRKIQNLNKPRSENLRHCLYGLDADLIMLGLVAHENQFTLLREKLQWKGAQNNSSSTQPQKQPKNSAGDEFHLLEISLLRDMLYLEFRPKEKFFYEYKIEKIVDDFIFMCMLIGNDFLPSLPHLSIASGGLNLLVRSYKEIQKNSSGYLTKKYQIHLGRVELFLEKLSNEAEKFYFSQVEKVKEEKSLEKDYKKNYYNSKLNFDYSSEQGNQKLQNLKFQYIQGLSWCLYYYHKGCPSWNWFFPEYYAPLTSDLKNLKNLKIRFTKGRPFEPLIQLLSVLPPKSSTFLPYSFAKLMNDDDSPILNFYPKNFKMDLNGKKNLWEGVVLLPFIDEKKLLEAICSVGKKDELNSEEKIRNCFGKDIVFFSVSFQ